MSRLRLILISAGITALVLAWLAFEIITTGPVRGALHTCAELLTIANRPGVSEPDRLAAARKLCSQRYLQTHQLAVADGNDGGLVGFPRNFNKNFKAWREGPNVWICPTNRDNPVRPVYQFVFEDGGWRFDGPVAILRPWGQIVRTSELPDEARP
ncbi:MAG: hypothetical protein ACLQIB_46350 [Isosphaeraceae bacterium]